MTKLFLDTNILIDYLSRREPFFDSAALLFQLGKRRKCQLAVSSLSFATASFILQAHYKMSHESIVTLFSKLINLCNLTAVDEQIVKDAIKSEFDDFEDALQYYSAIKFQSDYIITRNKKDFSHSNIEVLTPDELLRVNNIL